MRKSLTITFPKRGSPPPEIEGYDREVGDPFVFTKKWPSCWFHGLTETGRHICAMYTKLVDQNVCESCSARAAR